MKIPKQIQPLVDDGLVEEYDPVIIELPQAVDAAANNHAESMQERDVNNMTSSFIVASNHPWAHGPGPAQSSPTKADTVAS